MGEGAAQDSLLLLQPVNEQNLFQNASVRKELNPYL